ncbi:hypothetical protein LQG66_21060 [Bradyrhizobium ontarionense]|uniref:Uncharacterized protein n=1 Tax=Bradyrhizobium ontarionense TaxID=2898149 RepID=A0ABY3R4Y6_9BRAD|nr:hypothetical protein [Bradyrhizobium sp. A19]UFZ01803.1 hypothetical protein LQG66_21060 [Bradyrhizobium sp. A19]
MPVVADHARRFMWRAVRGRTLRVVPALIMLVVLCVAAGKIWLGLAARDAVALPKRGSLFYEALAVLDPAPAAAVSVDAAEAAFRAATNDDRAGLIFRSEHAQQLIVRALSERPLQPRLWLWRVSLLERLDPDDPRIAPSMKMVYFTSPASGTLTAERLRAAVQLRKLDDRELADLIRADITMLLLQGGMLQGRNAQPAIIPSEIGDAYREGSTAGRALLVGVVADTRPDLLSLLR